MKGTCCSSGNKPEAPKTSSCGCGSEPSARTPSATTSCCAAPAPTSCCASTDPAQQTSCCAPAAPSRKKRGLASWIAGAIATPAGPVLRVATAWSAADYIGMIRSRIGGFRMSYTIQPGLYAIGNPDASSDVLVTANYKLSFDSLRRELEGISAWLLVLDTNGINVWCAAGKGTFGTAELVDRIEFADLAKVVSHRRLIVPQLGAPGIRAAEVQRRTGFRVSYGPVRAADLPAYLRDGYRATAAMREVRFTIADRLILTPIEINAVARFFPWYALVVLAIFGLQPHGIIFNEALRQGTPFLAAGAVAILAGAFVTPLLLPWIPFRSFALKGLALGGALFGALHLLVPFFKFREWTLAAAFLVFFPLLTSYLALQFTGATTFTNPSGVHKELRRGIPVYIAGGIVSVLLVLAQKVINWGLL